MQILFVHPNYPAQFGPALSRLRARSDVECVFATHAKEVPDDGVRHIRFESGGGATTATHYCSRSFENATWNAHAVYEACKAASDLRPDLIVGHSGFGTTLFLRELFDCPVVNHFEYFYRPRGTDMDFRPEFMPEERAFLRARARNAMILLDLEASSAGYTPTHWQHSLLPDVFQPGVEVIHDGIDTGFWRRRDTERRIGTERIPQGTRIVTYVARGLEALRGFDIFVRVANRIAAERSDVLFVVVGSDRSVYGGDDRHIEASSFREHVIASEQPDLARFRFLGTLPPTELAQVLSLSDVHLYLTVPFVLSWSLLDALACECTVVASNTAPVQEVIQDGETGLLADFYDVDGLAERALRVLDDPSGHRALATAGRALVEERYSVESTFPRLWALWKRVADGASASDR